MPNCYTDKVMAYLTDKPGEYVDGLALAKVGGAYAWRSRVSEARQRLEAAGQGTIRNVLQREPGGVCRSLYTFVPATPSSQAVLPW